MTNSVVRRFESYYIPEPNSGCWLWTATTIRSGYGQLFVAGKLERAHRVSWRLHHGPIPDGLFVLHSCDNRGCVNPGHLFLGTNADNLADMRAKGRSGRGQKAHAAKLKEEDVVKIREDHRIYSEIASDYGVHESTIGLIKNRTNWGWVE